MKKLRKFYCYFVAAFACAALLGVSVYAGETSTIGEHRKVSAELFLTDQGEVYSWRKHDGNGYFADPEKPIKIQGLSDIVEISGSLAHGAAIDSKGDLYAWGGYLDVGSSPQKILSNVTSVSVASYRYTGAAVTKDGRLYVWGELYTGDDKNWNPIYQTFSQPYQTNGFTEVATVCCENGGFSVIMKNGDLYTGSLPLFMKNTDLHNKALQEGPALTNVSSISSGNYFYLALTKNGDLYTWGETWEDALGQPSGSLSTPLMKNVSAACADLAGGMAVTKDGQTYLWGTVENLSEKSYFSYATPTAFDTKGRTFAAMAAQNGAHIGMTAEGELWIWYGKDPCKLLGKTGDYSPTPFEPDLSKLPAGYLASRRTVAPGFLVKENGDLYRWVMEDDRETRYLEKIEGISNVVDISVALDWTTAMPKNVAAVTADGSLYIWNVNPRSDSLGTGDQQDKEVPVKLDLENVVSVRLNAWGWGGGAITSNGELYLWGSKYMGDDEQHSPIVETALSPYQIENIGYITSFSTISGSEAAVTKEGDLYLWGFGAKKSGRKTTPHHRTTPYRALENIQSVELTYQQNYFPPGDSYAVTYDGELWHWWGSPDVQLNQLNLPPVQSVSCGATDCAAAVTRDGNVYLWGEPDKRRQGDIPPSSPPEPVEVYTGGDAVLALPGEKYHQILTESGNLYTWKEGSVPILTLSGVKVPGKVTGSMEKLQAGSGKIYQSGQFSDVDEGKWYGVQNQGTVRDAYQLGLMDGMGDGTFAPEGGLRISEALKLACALRAAYTGDQIPAAVKGKPWYGPYIHYAVSNGMMEIGEFEEYSAYATRAQMAYLFAAALPEDQLTLSDQAALPGDVADSDRYAQQIRLLYRAGVLQGEDSSGAFHGDSGITRAQAAAIISRLALHGKEA